MRLFQIFPSKGGNNYSREAINQGTAIIFKEIYGMCYRLKFKNLPTLEFFTCATHLQRTVQILLLNRGVNTCPYKFFVSVSIGKAFFIKGAYY